MSERPDPDSLVLLATYSDQAEAMTVRGLLAAEGIDVFVHGENPIAMEGSKLGSVVELRVMVRFDDLDEARELVEELDYAEHLPPEAVAPDPADRSLQAFNTRSPATQPGKDPTKAALLALLLPLGTGHYYAGRSRTGATLAVLQIACVVLWSQGWTVWPAMLGVAVFDALFSSAALRNDAADRVSSNSTCDD